MKNLCIKKTICAGLALILYAACFSSYSQKNDDKPSQKGSIKLQYNYPSDKIFKYVDNTKIVQDMDVNGQSMLVNISTYLGCEVKSTGRQGENLKLEIKIDSLSQNIESPQGTGGGPINDVKEKVFNMVLSPGGKAVDVNEASKIVFNIEGSGESNLAQTFTTFFPGLPKNLLKPGDTWVTNDTLNSKTQTTSTLITTQSNFKYEGIENINGIDCARISSTLSGSQKIITLSQGMEVHVSGPYTGTQVLLFAVKEGYYVRESVTTRMTGNIEMPGQNMSFPVIMTVTTTNEIIK